jgi:phage terminase small subunit
MLTDKEKVFVEEYLIDLNATRAAIDAGYSKTSARQLANRLLTKDYIQAEIEKQMAARSERTKITQDKVLNELAKIGFFDVRKLMNEKGEPIPLHEIDDETAAAIVGLDVLEEYEGTGKDKILIGHIKKYKLADKRAALVDIGKHLGMFIERKEVGNPGDFDKVGDDELERSITETVALIERARTKGQVPSNAQGKAKTVK